MKICIIGYNADTTMGFPVTVQWNGEGLKREWVACVSMEAAEEEARKRGFTHASDPTIRGRKALRKL